MELLFNKFIFPNSNIESFLISRLNLLLIGFILFVFEFTLIDFSLFNGVIEFIVLSELVFNELEIWRIAFFFLCLLLSFISIFCFY